MSESHRVEGTRVYCHVCEHEWDRSNGGLQCTACGSEFVEIVEPNSRPRDTSPPPISPRPYSPQSSQPSNPFHDHNPWAPDPEEDDITTFEFNTGGGRGTFSFSSRTYTFGGGTQIRTSTSRDVAADELRQNFEAMLGNIMGVQQRRQPAMASAFFPFPGNRNDRGFGSMQTGTPQDSLFSMLFSGPGGQRNPGQPPSPFDLLGAMLNPANAQRGDTVFSQEAFDRVMTQLMEQNQSSAPGPASESAIAALRKKPVDQSMVGSDGKAECSICMDSLDIGDEVTVLPCNHWFHGECVISWLREHDTCPHCRKAITVPEDSGGSPHSSRRRRSSRRSSSVASPMNAVDEGQNRDIPTTDSPSTMRDARQRYYGSQRTSEYHAQRPPRERRSSERSHRSSDHGGGEGSGAAAGVASWIRNRLPFS